MDIPYDVNEVKTCRQHVERASFQNNIVIVPEYYKYLASEFQIVQEILFKFDAHKQQTENGDKA